ncbi:hypothetical protein BpHYR1_050141 [Brachionus plicatilis]|uniref:Uncharacterized protein n=1 Tax=Brachionus plicatilis TaxID=10195 RepID=A0A3M7PPP6_BRAPC|nr:hypothetical protein BpHYR1_050141 [Brachionus plicatilis]
MKTFVYEEKFQLNGFWKAMESSNSKLAKFAKKIFTTPATSASYPDKYLILKIRFKYLMYIPGVHTLMYHQHTFKS